MQGNAFGKTPMQRIGQTCEDPREREIAKNVSLRLTNEPPRVRRVWRTMPHQRRRPRIPATGRVTLWLNTAQRDIFVHSRETPQALSHALHRAPVKKGKLTLRVTRESLDALILAAANATPKNASEERSFNTLIRYLESLEDRFEEDVGDEADAGRASSKQEPAENFG